jgi:hypothetical protein
MTDDRAGAPAVPRARGKGLLISGMVLLVVGVAAVVVGIVMTAGTASSLLNKISAAQTAPATFTGQLEGGTTYAVYEATRGASGIASIGPGEITVTGPSGSVSVTRTGDTVSTVGEDSNNYAEVAAFTPPASDTYTITVAAERSLVAVAPALSTAAKGFAWIVAVVLGGLVAVIGLILVIIGAVRRSSARSRQGTAPGSPPVADPAV